MFKKTLYIVLVLIVVSAIVILSNSKFLNYKPSQNSKIQIVAAENFWGSLVNQIGGNQVSVTSLVNDPNADPHQYEVNSLTAKLFAKANYVIVNGAGYDNWATSIINANPSSNRIVLNVANLLNKKNGDNPHFWYNPNYVNRVVLSIKNDLVKIKPKQSSYFNNNYQALVTKLAVYQNNLAYIKKNFSGVNVASTEDIFVYLAQASGLNLISPPDFMQAVANGNDPSASSIVTFENQLKSNQVKLLVYNSQTVNPITESIKNIARANNIPVIAISETIEPTNLSFEDWMNQQIVNIKNNL